MFPADKTTFFKKYNMSVVPDEPFYISSMSIIRREEKLHVMEYYFLIV